MESLYTTYRPQTFEDVAGQRPIVGALERAVVNETVGHAYLFCGPRGTGKTTLARILAKALECDAGPGVLPDGTCEQCEAIALGVHPDVLEIDAASRTSVNDIRDEVISKVNFAPVRGRFKVYVIDEVHMLSNPAFNALLKTLEEPPGHVVFILCTTDPQKIPPTVLSRVQRYNFSPLSDEDIRQRLEFICEREGFNVTPEALMLIVRHAHGGMRDAISTLEQLAVFGDGQVDEAMTRDLLGSSDQDTLVHFMEGLAARDAAQLFSLVGAAVSEGRDLQQFAGELMARVRDLYVVSVAGPLPGVIAATEREARELGREAALFGDPQRLSRILGELDAAAYALRSAPDPRLTFEVALTKLVRPECDETLEALAERVARLESGHLPATPPQPSAAPVREEPRRRAPSAPSPGGNRGDMGAPRQGGGSPAFDGPSPGGSAAPSAAMPRSGVAPVPRGQGPAAPPSPSGPSPVDVPPPSLSAPTVERPVSEPEVPPAVSPAPEPVPSGTPAPERGDRGGPVPVAADAGEAARRWAQVVEALPASQAAFLADSTLLEDNGARLLVDIAGSSHFALGILNRADMKASVEKVAERFFGRRSVEYAGSPAPGRGASRPAAPPAPALPRTPSGSSVPAPSSPSGPQSPSPRSRLPRDVPPWEDLPWEAGSGAVPNPESSRDGGAMAPGAPGVGAPVGTADGRALSAPTADVPGTPQDGAPKAGGIGVPPRMGTPAPETPGTAAPGPSTSAGSPGAPWDGPTPVPSAAPGAPGPAPSPTQPSAPLADRADPAQAPAGASVGTMDQATSNLINERYAAIMNTLTDVFGSVEVLSVEPATPPALDPGASQDPPGSPDD